MKKIKTLLYNFITELDNYRRILVGRPTRTMLQHSAELAFNKVIEQQANGYLEKYNTPIIDYKTDSIKIVCTQKAPVTFIDFKCDINLDD